MEFLGSLISAGTNLIGGIMGQQAQDRRAEQNIAMQREFAQQGIGWKVADAKRAGISPLAALGASTSSFSNVVGGEGTLGEGVQKAGQDIGRAFTAQGTREERLLASEGARLDIERKKIENAMLLTDLGSKFRRTVGAAGNPPPIPDPADPWFPTPTSDPRKSTFPEEDRLQNVGKGKGGDEGTSGIFGGREVKPNVNFSDVNKWAENRYGDDTWVTNVIAMGVAGADVWENFGRPGVEALIQAAREAPGYLKPILRDRAMRALEAANRAFGRTKGHLTIPDRR